MFEDHVRAAHEADAERLINLILEREWRGSNCGLLRFLVRQDRTRRLKINSSQINIFIIPELRELFPGSRFILTMRHPLEWLRSMMDDSLRRDAADHWHRFRDFRFGSRDNLPPEETVLAQASLYSLSGYLNYWRTAIDLSRHAIGAEPLLILRTQDLLGRAHEIAEFCGSDGFVPQAYKSHAFANPERFGLLEQIDADYLVEMTEAVCGELLREFYPECDTREVLAELVSRDHALRLAGQS